MMTRERPQLTIRLERKRESLERVYYNRHGEFGSNWDIWEEVGINYRLAHRSGLDALNKLLDDGSPGKLVQHFTGDRLLEAGQVMFEALLGDDWKSLLHRVVEGQTHDSYPTRLALRVRILTDDPVLANLPWSITAWQGRTLLDHDWTFEVVSREVPIEAVEIRQPCRILVIAPNYEKMKCIDTARHLNSLLEALGRVSGDYHSTSEYLTVAQGRQAVRHALECRTPDVLYFFGHSSTRDGELLLQLGAPGAMAEPTTVRELKQWMSRRFPKIAFFNGCRTGQKSWSSASHQLSMDVPLVIAHRTNAWSPQTGEMAVQWFKACLGELEEPVPAIHRLQVRANTRVKGWTALTIHTDYSTLRIRRPPGRRPLINPLSFDRDAQRALTVRQVAHLARDEKQRVEAILAYADVGNLVEEISGQLFEDIGIELHGKVHAEALTVHLPYRKDHLFQALDDALDRGRTDGEFNLKLRDLEACLDGDVVPVLWLDWRHPMNEPSELSETDIRTWFAYGCERLADACPESLRIVSFISIQKPADEHDRFHKTIDSFREKIWSEQFHITLLPALGNVSTALLMDELRKKYDCPTGLVSDVARSIHAVTNGVYGDVMEWIRLGMDSTWHYVLDELQTGKG